MTALTNYRNRDYDLYTVLAQPEDGSEAWEGFPCRHESCSKPSGVHILAPRTRAIHLIRRHVRFPHLGLCRFATEKRGEYVSDLTFEIDVHVSGLGYMTRALYEPIIRAAASIGRRIYDYLTNDLAVDPRYITTSVTRMGATVTVDWRAFGPQSLRQLLAVTCHLSEITCPTEYLESLRTELLSELEPLAGGELDLGDLGVIPAPKLTAKLEVDTRIYEQRDHARLDQDGNQVWLGPHLRPLGALHAKSSEKNLYIRRTPVPHNRFRPETAEWLTWVSRSTSPEVSSFPIPELFTELLDMWPEARIAKYDHVIEDNPNPSAKLIALFAGWKSLELSEVSKRKLNAQRPKGTTIRGKSGELSSEPLDSATISRLVAHVPDLRVVRGDPTSDARVTCPYEYCRGKSSDSAQMSPRGFHCHRCHTSVSLVKLAVDFGLGHLVPGDRVGNQEPIQPIELASLPPRDPCEEWDSEVISPEFGTVQDARADMARVVTEFVQGDGDLLIVQAAAGLGKTHTILQTLRSSNEVIFGAFPRDESKLPMLQMISPSRDLRGLRPGENCTNPDAAPQLARGVPSGEVCGECPSRAECPYRAQFRGLDGVSLAGHLAHLPHLPKALQEGAGVLYVDENAIANSIQNVDFDSQEISLGRCKLELNRHDPSAIDLDLERDTLQWVAPTPTLERVFQGLETLLSKDTVLAEQLSEIRTSGGQRQSVDRTCVADGSFLSLLQAQTQLQNALRDLTDEDFARLDYCARGLDLHDHQPEGEPSEQDNYCPLTEAEIAEMLRGSNRKPYTEPTPKPPQPLRQITRLVRTLSLLRGSPNQPVFLRRRDDRRWCLRLSIPTPIPRDGWKIVLSSATIRPEQARLMFGDISSAQVYIPRVKDPSEVVVIGDRTYSQTCFENDEKLTAKTFETVLALIKSEKTRTGLPVAVIGSAALTTKFNQFALGKLSQDLQFPLSGDRNRKSAELRELTEPLGYISGYSRAVEGNNDFSVLMPDGTRRFCRALIVLGSVLPPVGEIELDYRGLYAGREESITTETEVGPMLFSRPLTVDWSPVFRTVPLAGTEFDGGKRALATVRQVGFADPRCNEILHANFEAVVTQIVGRLRATTPDPIDPTIVPRVYLIGPVAVDGLRVTRTATLDQIRTELGLSSEATKGWHPSPETIRRDWPKLGRTKIIRRIVAWLIANQSSTPVPDCGRLVLAAGHDWEKSHQAIAREAAKKLQSRPK